jgi:hypothetical protein
LFARTRVRYIVYPRQIFFHLAYTYNTDLSLSYVGAYAGEKSFDHSTVLYAKNTIDNLAQVDKNVKQDLRIIKELIEVYKTDKKYPFEFRKHQIMNQLFKANREEEFNSLLEQFALENEKVGVEMQDI